MTRFADGVRLVAGGGCPIDRREPVAMVGDPDIGAVLDPANRRDSISQAESCPPPAKLSQHAVDGGGAGKCSAAWLDRPGSTVHAGAGQAVPIEDPWRLIW